MFARINQYLARRRRERAAKLCEPAVIAAQEAWRDALARRASAKFRGDTRDLHAADRALMVARTNCLRAERALSEALAGAQAHPRGSTRQMAGGFQ